MSYVAAWVQWWSISCGDWICARCYKRRNTLRSIQTHYKYEHGTFRRTRHKPRAR